MNDTLQIGFFGSSLLSAYWNGAATYYRGIIKELYKLGHKVTFFEPDAFDRQQHRDLPEPEWAKVVVYPATQEGVDKVLAEIPRFDVVIKASGVGVFDEYLEKQVLRHRQTEQLTLFWDVDAPATLARMNQNTEDALRQCIPEYDFIFTYGGGQAVIDAYKALGAKACFPVYNALDPETHHGVEPQEKYQYDLIFMGNRLPDREERVEEFFFRTAKLMPHKRFALGGNGWGDKPMPENVDYLGHVYTKDHNTLNCSPLAVLNINRESMADTGFSPATRIFEAAGAGACIISDKWAGIEEFLEPGKEILLAESAEKVAAYLEVLDFHKAQRIGDAAMIKVLSEHTYAHRAERVESILFKHLKKAQDLNS
jgi:spore maturation protein CgeB